MFAFDKVGGLCEPFLSWYEEGMGPEMASVLGAFDPDKDLRMGGLAQVLEGGGKPPFFAIGNY